MRGGPGSTPRGVGYINPRAVSGYTSLSITKDTRALLRRLQDAAAVASADELIFLLVEAELSAAGINTMESREPWSDPAPDSIERAPLSPSTPEGE